MFEIEEIEIVKKRISIFFLSIKYWIQGDDWKKAVEYAEALINGWR